VPMPLVLRSRWREPVHRKRVSLHKHLVLPVTTISFRLAVAALLCCIMLSLDSATVLDVL